MIHAAPKATRIMQSKGNSKGTGEQSYRGMVQIYRGFFFSSRRRHTRFDCDWSSDVCSSDLCRRSSGGRGTALSKRDSTLVVKQKEVLEARRRAPAISGTRSVARGMQLKAVGPELATNGQGKRSLTQCLSITYVWRAQAGRGAVWGGPAGRSGRG